MAIRHLSEQELQAYLEGKLPQDKSDFEDHLRTCQVCQRNMIVYQKLYGELNRQVEVTLPNNFAAKVTTRIQLAQEKKSVVFEWTFLTLGFILSLGTVFYFLNWKNLAQIILNIYQKNSALGRDIVSIFQSISSWCNGNTDIALFIGALIILVGLIDKLFVRPKFKLG